MTDTETKLADALRRAERKLSAYVGVCTGDTELTNTVLPMCREALASHDTARAQPVNISIPREWREFVSGVAAQGPSKPDYWSSCDQCERNASNAQDLLAAAPQPAQPASVAEGFFIGGPHATAIVHDLKHAGPVIAALCSCTGDDTDDYSVTDLSQPTAKSAHGTIGKQGWGDPIPYPKMGDEPVAHVGAPAKDNERDL